MIWQIPSTRLLKHRLPRLEEGTLSRPILRFWVVLWMILSVAVAISAACTPSPTPTPIPTVWPTITLPRPTAPPTKSVEQVTAAVKSSAYLDRMHLDKGVSCQTCHDPFPPQAPPSTEKCLSCHKGSYEELAQTTIRLDPISSHKSHLGAEPCVTCHCAHKPFVYHCATCHTDRTYTGRYATGK